MPTKVIRAVTEHLAPSQFLCLRCKHRWLPRKMAAPVVCPKCKSPYWNVKPSKKAQRS